MDIAIAIIGSGALSAVISGLFALASARQKKDQGVQAGVRIILYDRIKFLGTRYIAAGEVGGEDLEDLIQMHKIYHDDLEGNGYLDKVMADVQKLKIK